MAVRVLFLTANPENQVRLKLDEEIRSIRSALRGGIHRDDIELEFHPAARPADLQSALLQHEPHIVHFSGHGSEQDEILMMNDDRMAVPVQAEALHDLFDAVGESVHVVILNACFSESQAAALCRVADCAIGMHTAVGDRAAITFATAFYEAIGYGRSVEKAFDAGKAALRVHNLPDYLTPRLVVREGVSAADLSLFRREMGPRSLPSVTAPSPPSPGIPPPVVSPSSLHVDRRSELRTFEAMLGGTIGTQILLIEAASGMGKSALLEEYWRRTNGLHRSRVILRKASYTPEEVLSDIAFQLGTEFFRGFLRRREEFHLALVNPSPGGGLTAGIDTREYWRRLLTDAFFDELAVLARASAAPIILLLDEFDKASEELSDWFVNEFMERVRRSGRVIVAAAGQRIPAVVGDWDEFCLRRSLDPFGHDEVMEMADAMHLDLSREIIGFIHDHSEGNPFKVLEMLRTCQRRRQQGSASA